MGARIVVEVASNHQGNILLAREFIRIAARAGADCVKFQSSRYQDLADKSDPQADWVRQTSLSDNDHFELIAECRKHQVDFLTTCFSIGRVDFLASLGLKEVKIASPDLLSFAMIEKLAGKFDHLIVSTGMHTIREIKKTIDFLLDNKINATLLHSVSMYPTPLNKAFMYKFLWLKDNFPRVGYSNHAPDAEPAKFSMAHGAQIVEVHMKLGRYGPGRAADWDLLTEQVEDIVRYRSLLRSMLGKKKDSQNEDFLYEEEVAAAKRFVGRWGRNR
ncbi:MAG: N-acetylneuraminate synthase family protein [Phycisphaerales bacterium]|nr:MAG: N-acetylneuraminate synthase family protein [Phycisphaerales bacterium]